MTRCEGSPKKHRVSKPHGSHSHAASKSGYEPGLRGHSWEKTETGRRCGNYPKVHNVPEKVK